MGSCWLALRESATGSVRPLGRVGGIGRSGYSVCARPLRDYEIHLPCEDFFRFAAPVVVPDSSAHYSWSDLDGGQLLLPVSDVHLSFSQASVDLGCCLSLWDQPCSRRVLRRWDVQMIIEGVIGTKARCETFNASNRVMSS